METMREHVLDYTAGAYRAAASVGWYTRIFLCPACRCTEKSSHMAPYRGPEREALTPRSVNATRTPARPHGAAHAQRPPRKVKVKGTRPLAWRRDSACRAGAGRAHARAVAAQAHRPSAPIDSCGAYTRAGAASRPDHGLTGPGADSNLRFGVCW